MKALEFVADVDAQHRLYLELPGTLPGPVRVLVLLPEPHEASAETTDETESVWMRAVSREWAEELADPREDIYTLEDGDPIHAAR